MHFMSTKRYRPAQSHNFTDRPCPKCKKIASFNPLMVRNIEQEFTPAQGPTRIDRVSYITCPNCQYKYFEVHRKTIGFK